MSEQEEMDEIIDAYMDFVGPRIIPMARSLRLAITQSQYDQGNLTEEQARKILSGPLTPGDESTIYDDSDQLQVRINHEHPTDAH